jgi:DNA-binding response OmpR family regulator
MDKPQLLLVEDDLDLSEMVSSYFRVQNYDVLTAAWGEDALQLADENMLDLIMLDVRLPDIDGFELCKRLRESRKTQDTPILFLTEKRDRIDKLQGLELGVVDYITKPFDIQELRLRVRNAIARAKASSSLNAITGLPEGHLVDEKLSQTLDSETQWALLRLSITSLKAFHERYGFVAADDVLRSVTLIVRNAVKEHGQADDFIGHLAPETFVVITQQSAVAKIQQRVERRVEQSREYFYPPKDRGQAQEAMREQHLRVVCGTVDYTGSYENVDNLKTKLEKACQS